MEAMLDTISFQGLSFLLSRPIADRPHAARFSRAAVQAALTTNSRNATGIPSPRAKLISAVTPTLRHQPGSMRTSRASARWIMQRSKCAQKSHVTGRLKRSVIGCECAIGE